MATGDLVDRLLAIHKAFSESESDRKTSDYITVGQVKGQLSRETDEWSNVRIHASFRLTDINSGVIFDKEKEAALRKLIAAYELNLFVTNNESFHYEAYIRHGERPVAIVTPHFFLVNNIAYNIVPGFARSLVKFYEENMDLKFEDKW